MTISVCFRSWSATQQETFYAGGMASVAQRSAEGEGGVLTWRRGRRRLRAGKLQLLLLLALQGGGGTHTQHVGLLAGFYFNRLSLLKSPINQQAPTKPKQAAPTKPPQHPPNQNNQHLPNHTSTQHTKRSSTHKPPQHPARQATYRWNSVSLSATCSSVSRLITTSKDASGKSRLQQSDTSKDTWEGSEGD
ncbi:hypothetical protein ACK3TF_003978 [Chlorella vulgaris]